MKKALSTFRQLKLHIFQPKKQVTCPDNIANNQIKLVPHEIVIE